MLRPSLEPAAAARRAVVVAAVGEVAGRAVAVQVGEEEAGVVQALRQGAVAELRRAAEVAGSSRAGAAAVAVRVGRAAEIFAAAVCRELALDSAKGGVSRAAAAVGPIGRVGISAEGTGVTAAFCRSPNRSASVQPLMAASAASS